jgi:hypothetical protein
LCDKHAAVRVQTSDLLAGLRLAADKPPMTASVHHEAGSGAATGASQVALQAYHSMCPATTGSVAVLTVTYDHAL